MGDGIEVFDIGFGWLLVKGKGEEGRSWGRGGVEKG